MAGGRRVGQISWLRLAAIVHAVALFGVLVAGSRALLSQGHPAATSADSIARLADEAYDRGDVEKAIELYERLIKIEPNSVEARTNLGVALARVGRYGDAVAQYRQALSRDAENSVVQLNLSLAYYKEAEFAAAATELERLRMKHADNMQSLYLLADCYLRLGRNRDAISLLQPLYAANPDDRGVGFALGMALIRDGKSEDGKLVIGRAMTNGDSSEVQVLLGAAQLAAHDSTAAAATLHHALDTSPNLPEAWSLYGRALLNNGDRDGAKSAFQRALKIDPNDFDANLYLGGMQRYDGNASEAAPYIEKALALRPASVEARFQRGLIRVANGHSEEALADLEEVERTSPDFQEVHVQLAVVYARLHRMSDSERERAKVSELDEKAREQAVPQSHP